jgi:hypothetical protein
MRQAGALQVVAAPLVGALEEAAAHRCCCHLLLLLLRCLVGALEAAAAVVHLQRNRRTSKPT